MKYSLAITKEHKHWNTETAVCPPNDNLVTDGGNLAVVYRYYNLHANGNKELCPKGVLLEPDRRTLLGHNDGSGILPRGGSSTQHGDGFCSDRNQKCLCYPTVTLNSP